MQIKAKRGMAFVAPLISLFAMFVLLLILPTNEMNWLVISVSLILAILGAVLFGASNVKIIENTLQLCTYSHVSKEIDLTLIDRIDISYDKSEVSSKVGPQPQVKYLNFICNDAIRLRFSKEMFKDDDIRKLVQACQQVNPLIDVDLNADFFAVETRRKVR